MQEQPPTIVNNYITITDSVITRSRIGEVKDKNISKKIKNLPSPKVAGYVDVPGPKISGKMRVKGLARFNLNETVKQDHCRHRDALTKNLEATIESNRALDKSLEQLEEEGRKLQAEIDEIHLPLSAHIRMIPCYIALLFFTGIAYWEYHVMPWIR